MASEEEVYKYILKVEGDEKVKSAAAAAALAEQKFQAMFSTLGAGAPQTRAAAAALVDLQKPLAAAQSSSRDLGRATLEASRGLEDLQYGVAGVLNNLPGLVSSLGGGAGLAGIISIVAVGSKVLYDHWGDLAGLFGQGATKSEAERMEELGKKTEKTADETARLLKYEEGRQHVAAQGQKPEAATKFGQAVDKAISEGPLAEVNKGLDKHFGARIGAMADVDPRAEEARRDLAEKQAALERIRRQTAPGESQTWVLKAEQEREAAQGVLNGIRGEARERFRIGLTDPANAGTLAKVSEAARAHPRDFGPNGEKFADSLDATIDPAAATRKKIVDALGKMADKIAEKFPKLAEAAQDKLDAAAAAIDDIDMAVEETNRKERRARIKKNADSEAHYDKQEQEFASKKAQAEESIRVEARDKAQHQLEQRATTGTGLDARGEMAMLRSMLSGGSQAQVTSRVAVGMSRELRARGLDPQRAMELAMEHAQKLAGSVGDDIMGRAMHGPERHPVERIGVGDFSASVESRGAVKLEKLTEEMKTELAAIRRNTNGINTVRGG